MYNNGSLNSSKTNTMVKAGLLTALSIVLTRFFSFILPVAGLPTIRIGFGSIPIAVSGILFGPLAGAGTGFAADILGVLVNSQGAFHPGFSLSSTLQGAIPGLIFMFFRRENGSKDLITVRRVFIQELVTTLIVALGLNTLWLSQMFGKGFFILLPGRLLSSAINLVINTIIIYNLTNRLYKY